MIIRRVKFEHHHRKVFFPTPRGVKNFWRHPYWRDTLHKQSQTCMFDEMMYQMDSNPLISKFFSHVWKVFYPSWYPKEYFIFVEEESIQEKMSREELVDEVKPCHEESEMYFTFEKSSIFWEIFEYGFGLWLTKR